MPRGTQAAPRAHRPSPTGFSPSLTAVPNAFGSFGLRYPGGLQPRPVAEAVWAPPLSLATTRGIFSFPRATEMFQFARFPSLAG